MKRAHRLGLLRALLLLLPIACSRQPVEGASDGGGRILYYQSSMDPSFISLKPGKDGMGMELKAVHEGDPGANLGTIVLNGATVQRMGVRLEPVRKEALTRIVRALGRMEFDETRVSSINMKFDGWIEKLYVDETGQYVKRGAPLFAVYSPELVASEEEYIQMLSGVGEGPHVAHLREAARKRLLQFDVPASLVAELTRSRKAQRLVTIYSPADGYVVHKTAFEGTYVKKGGNLFTLADLKALWVMAEVYEFDSPWVAAGQVATVELDYLPGQLQEAVVDYVYPTLNEKTRTIQVRLELPNPRVALKPGMLATVRIHAKPVGETLVVPAEAVIHSGERNLVFVALGDGRFEPRELRLGVRGDGVYQVLGGVVEGEQVVVSGQFLLDSESQLKMAVQKMLGSNVLAPTAGDAGPMAMDPAMPMGSAEGDGGHAGEDH